MHGTRWVCWAFSAFETKGVSGVNLVEVLVPASTTLFVEV
jgi:hypothetical protein